MASKKQETAFQDKGVQSYYQKMLDWAGDDAEKKAFVENKADQLKGKLSNIMLGNGTPGMTGGAFNPSAAAKAKNAALAKDAFGNPESVWSEYQFSRTPEKAQETAEQVKTEAKELLGGEDAAGTADIAALREYLSGIQQQSTPEFSYDWDAAVDRFSNKAIDEQINRATEALERSAANRGQFYSSDTLKRISDRAQSLAQENVQNAMKLALEDKNAALQEYATKLNADQTARAQALGGLNALAGLGNTNISQLAQIVTGATQAAGDTGINYYGTRFAADEAKKEAEKNRKAQQEQSWLGTLGGIIGAALGK